MFKTVLVREYIDRLGPWVSLLDSGVWVPRGIYTVHIDIMRAIPGYFGEGETESVILSYCVIIVVCSTTSTKNCVICPNIDTNRCVRCVRILGPTIDRAVAINIAYPSNRYLTGIGASRNAQH